MTRAEAQELGILDHLFIGLWCSKATAATDFGGGGVFKMGGAGV